MTVQEYTKKYIKHKKYVEWSYSHRQIKAGEAICMIPTSDEWWPNYDGNFVQVSLLKLRNSPKHMKWRVCVWGADDHGFERDTTKEEAVKLYKTISRWKDCTKGKLKKLGFYNA